VKNVWASSNEASVQIALESAIEIQAFRQLFVSHPNEKPFIISSTEIVSATYAVICRATNESDVKLQILVDTSTMTGMVPVLRTEMLLAWTLF
jgi:hypothetical protein